jgi:c-di-AMP phosphodiesterase-like protein
MPLPGIAIAKCEGKHVDVQVIIPVRADEDAQYQRRQASFVVVKATKDLPLSAPAPWATSTSRPSWKSWAAAET